VNVSVTVIVTTVNSSMFIAVWNTERDVIRSGPTNRRHRSS